MENQTVKMTRFFAILGLCGLLCLMVGVVAGPVHAQVGKAGGAAGLGKDVGVGGDRSISSKKGMEVLGGSKTADPSRTPGKAKIALGLGSVVVAIAVVKWL